jgi:hypothetical protein
MIYPFGISVTQAGLFILHKSIVTARGLITKQFRRILAHGLPALGVGPSYWFYVDFRGEACKPLWWRLADRAVRQ